MATIHLNTFIGGKIAKPSISTKYGDVVLYSRVDGGIDRFTGSQGEADEIKRACVRGLRACFKRV
ncbi:hypothetical protein FACS1894188_01660 [Clostridia bacterium]|nr:hypothetical protein FACS1894188_01660 [Clostridia bacterium]